MPAEHTAPVAPSAAAPSAAEPSAAAPSAAAPAAEGAGLPPAPLDLLAGVRRPLPATGLQAVLFDMDGTLVETEDVWWEAETAVLAELGCPVPSASRKIVVGGPMSRVVDHLLAVTGAPLEPAELGALIEERYLRLLDGQVPLRPGALELLDALAAEGVPAALVSAAQRRTIDQVLRTLGSQRFGFTVGGDEVERTKPDPEPYLVAAERLGAEPSRCVVIEDSPLGVAAGEAAGCAVLAVPSVAVIDPAPGRTVLASLRGVTPELLRGLVAR